MVSTLFFIFKLKQLFFPMYFFHCGDNREGTLYYIYTVKALLSPRGAYLISDLPEGGLNREGGLLERGGLFTKSSDKDIFGSFSVLLSHSLRNQGTILRLKYVNSTQFLFQNVPKLTWKVV